MTSNCPLNQRKEETVIHVNPKIFLASAEEFLKSNSGVVPSWAATPDNSAASYYLFSAGNYGPLTEASKDGDEIITHYFFTPCIRMDENISVYFLHTGEIKVLQDHIVSGQATYRSYVTFPRAWWYINQAKLLLGSELGMLEVIQHFNISTTTTSGAALSNKPSSWKLIPLK